MIATVDTSISGARATSPRSNIVVAHAIADLAQVLENGVNVAVFERSLAESIEQAARVLVASPTFGVTAVVEATAGGRTALLRHFEGAEVLGEDVFFWLEVMAELTGASRLGVRVTRMERAMCPRLHVDQVMLRLVSTYVGNGTEYVDDANVNRSALGPPKDAPSEKGELLRESAIQHASVGDIVLLKGEQWPGNAGRGAVHRSPSASASAPRLALTIDILG